MNKQKKRPDLLRCRNMVIRLTESEFDLICERAEESGLSHSEYCRKQILTGRVIQRFEFVADMTVIRDASRQLSGIGNNLNQIAQYFHMGGARSLYMQEEIHKAILAVHEMNEKIQEIAGEKRGLD